MRTLAASLALPLWLASYAALCMAQPFAPCRKCNGAGHTHTPRGRQKPCKRCRGKGRRLRRGRRALNAWLHTHERGTR